MHRARKGGGVHPVPESGQRAGADNRVLVIKCQDAACGKGHNAYVRPAPVYCVNRKPSARRRGEKGHGIPERWVKIPCARASQGFQDNRLRVVLRYVKFGSSEI